MGNHSILFPPMNDNKKSGDFLFPPDLQTVTKKMKKNLKNIEKNIENEKTESATNKGDRKILNKFIANTDYYEFKIITETKEYLHMDLKAYFKRKNITVVPPPKDPPPDIELPLDGEITLKDLTLMVINLNQIVVNLNQTVLNLKTSVEAGFANVNQRLDNLEKDVATLKEDVSDIKVRVGNLEKDVADIKKCPTIQKELSELAN